MTTPITKETRKGCKKIINHNEIQIEIYQKNNNEIWDERLNGNTVVTKM